jgi:hypothetical protein
MQDDNAAVQDLKSRTNSAENSFLIANQEEQEIV